MRQRRLRCAIYTRKSTDAGLEQDFNSLDAQREACEAYIKSQCHEGWVALSQRYDDGGFSGGSLERPALQKLQSGIKAGKVDVILVYKVDRLTRSLADFAKLVERFDTHSVSFVSVTQHFNTTTSMGRLTLNVLLSFAQFEREVSGERIRDKIAASKAKGIWMGGVLPLGYDVVDRKLVVNAAEARAVRQIYEAYLEVKSVRLLKEALDRRGIVSKARRQKNGQIMAGGAFSRGHLYRLLSNPLYRGKLQHKGKIHDGQHKAIIAVDLWDKVQDLLRQNRRGEDRISAKDPSLLAGLLTTAEGQKLVPSHAVKKGRRYRYYIARHLAQEIGVGTKGARYAAHEVETAVLEALRRFLDEPAEVAAVLEIEDLTPTAMKHITVKANQLSAQFACRQSALPLIPKFLSGVTVSSKDLKLNLRPESLASAIGIEARSSRTEYTITTPCQLVRRGQELKFILPGRAGSDICGVDDPALRKAVAKAHLWWLWIRSGQVTSLREIAHQEGLDPSHVTRLLRLAFLSPRLVRKISSGTQPADLTVEALTRKIDLPLAWAAQEQILS